MPNMTTLEDRVLKEGIKIKGCPKRSPNPITLMSLEEEELCYESMCSLCMCKEDGPCEGLVRRQTSACREERPTGRMNPNGPWS